MMDDKSILFVGVGGQGIILSSKILTEGLVMFGFDVKMSEVHGMAQRGGSVTTQVRFGDKVYSPLIGAGQADIIVAFEKVEGARYLQYLKPDGALIINNYEIHPVPVLIGDEQYPLNVIDKLKEAVPHTFIIDAAEISEKLGNIKVQNIVLLGALIKALKLENLEWEEVIRKNVPDKYYDLNIKAFKSGLGLVF